MPQLDPHSFPPQLIWLALTFIALFIFLSKVALPKVGSAIERRREKVEGDLARAAKLKAEIDTVIDAYERALDEAKAQASLTVNQTKEHVARVSAERQAAAIAAINEQSRAAEARIATAKADALANIRTVAIEVAGAATARLIGQAPKSAAIEAAVDQAMGGST